MSIPDHLITPLDWSAEALRHAAAWTGQPEGARALVESRLYLAMHELIERLQAEAAALSRERDELQAQLARVHDAREEIALAGMSGSGRGSPEAMRDWHARRAWEFIGIAARA